MLQRCFKQATAGCDAHNSSHSEAVACVLHKAIELLGSPNGTRPVKPSSLHVVSSQGTLSKKQTISPSENPSHKAQALALCCGSGYLQ